VSSSGMADLKSGSAARSSWDLRVNQESHAGAAETESLVSQVARFRRMRLRIGLLIRSRMSKGMHSWPHLI
jgi:hypothetical protein